MAEKEALHETAHVSPHLDSDRPTKRDALGFTPYVRAMAEYLTHPSTTYPLTISVEGEWGSGKTSFMKQLQDRLSRRKFATVWFEPWTYRKPESLWAAFALSCVEQLAQSRPAWLRPLLRARLLFRRLNLRILIDLIWQLAFRGSLLALIWLWLGRALVPLLELTAVQPSSAPAIDLALKVGASLWAGVPVLKELDGVVGGVLEAKLKRYLKSPDYAEHADLLARLRKDFKAVLSTYAGKRPVVVCVDDLDRCAPDVVAEMMQAINLLIDDDPQMVFVVGLDREMVAAAYAARNEKLLPHLAQSTLSTRWGPEGDRGLSFGLSYLEKFITVPFRLPTHDGRSVERLVESLMPHRTEEGRPRLFARLSLWIALARWRRKFWFSRKVDEVAAGRAEVEQVEDYEFAVSARAQHRRQRLRVELYEETDSVREIIAMVAPLFYFNPRRLKQFLNLLRLRAYMANETGLFDEVAGSEWVRGHAALTLPQLGKLVAIGMRWPGFFRDVQAIPGGLRSLAEVAYGRIFFDTVDERVRQWAKNRELMSLLRVGCFGAQAVLEPGLVDEYGIGEVDLDWFAAIAPQVLRRGGTIIKDRPWNYTDGSVDFWRQNRRKLGPIVRAVMRDDNEPDGYYLRLIDEDENEIWLSGTTTQGGTGRAGTLEVLLEAGFRPEEELRELIWSMSGFELGRLPN